VLFPAPFVIEAPGDCWRGVPFALIPFTTSIFGPDIDPESEFTPELTPPPLCASATPAKPP
jgi:hypothetical protein